jgi:hypothetical protein
VHLCYAVRGSNPFQSAIIFKFRTYLSQLQAANISAVDQAQWQRTSVDQNVQPTPRARHARPLTSRQSQGEGREDAQGRQGDIADGAQRHDTAVSDNGSCSDAHRGGQRVRGGAGKRPHARKHEGVVASLQEASHLGGDVTGAGDAVTGVQQVLVALGRQGIRGVVRVSPAGPARRGSRARGRRRDVEQLGVGDRGDLAPRVLHEDGVAVVVGKLDDVVGKRDDRASGKEGWPRQVQRHVDRFVG